MTCVALVAVALLGLAGCASKVGIAAVSSDEKHLNQEVHMEHRDIELQIRQSFMEHLGWEDLVLDDVSICKYYGEYNGCHVVMMTTSKSCYTMALWSETVAGVRIHYRDGNRILAWKDGQFVNLADAHDNGWLAKGDIQKIADIQKPDWMDATC